MAKEKPLSMEFCADCAYHVCELDCLKNDERCSGRCLISRRMRKCYTNAYWKGCPNFKSCWDKKD